MLVEEIVNGTKGKLINGNENHEVEKFIIDNREENKDSFFIPIVGEKVDAHRFILGTVGQGIKGFFINKNYNEKDKVIKESIEKNNDIIIIEVEDTLKALYDLALYNRNKHLDVKVVAVTGSVGKTSTREMIYSVVKKGKEVLVTEKNYNGYIGLSLMMLKLKNQDLCVLEAGIDRFGEMDELSKLLVPDIAVITMIGTSHIEKLKSQENIFKEKFCITKTLRGINTLIVNNNDKYLSNVKDNSRFNIQRYDINDVFDISFSIDGITFSTKIYGKEEGLHINALGNHNIQNALAAIKVGELLNISKEDIISGISNYRNFPRRMEIKKAKKGFTIIDDAYNASLDSMKSGLNTIDKIPGNKIAVLGDMLELGDYSKTLHEEVGKEFKNLSYKTLITFGDNSKFINKEAKKYSVKCIHFNDKSDLIEYINKNVNKDDIVYFKASNGMKFSEIIESLI